MPIYVPRSAIRNTFPFKPEVEETREDLPCGGYKITTKVGNAQTETSYFNSDDKLHRENDLPAYELQGKRIVVDPITFDEHVETYLRRVWYKDGMLHREGDEPAWMQAVTVSDGTEILKSFKYCKDGVSHRDNNKPAYQQWVGGKLTQEAYYVRGVQSRPDNKGYSRLRTYFNGTYVEEFINDGVPMDINKPKRIYYGEDGSRKEEYFDDENWKCRYGGLPCLVEYWPNGNLKRKEYRIQGVLHNVDNPAYIEYDEGGNIIHEEWKIFGILHRDENAPAFYRKQKKDGEEYVQEAYVRYGNLSNPEGGIGERVIQIDEEGTEKVLVEVWLDDQGRLHRDGDEPALMYKLNQSKKSLFDRSRIKLIGDYNSWGNASREVSCLQSLLHGSLIETYFSYNTSHVTSYFKNGVIHRGGGKPAIQMSGECVWAGETHLTLYVEEGLLHREGNKPAMISDNFLTSREVLGYYVKGKPKRHKKLPQNVTLLENGNIYREIWYNTKGVIKEIKVYTKRGKALKKHFILKDKHNSICYVYNGVTGALQKTLKTNRQVWDALNEEYPKSLLGEIKHLDDRFN